MSLLPPSPLILAALALVACSPEHRTYAQYGAQLARSTDVATNRRNAFTCLTCHAERARDAGARIYPGAVLEGAVARPRWWGGEALDLDRAVALCFEHFMGGPTLDPAGETAQALDAYLIDLAVDAPAATTAAVPFTVPATVTDIAPGDSTRGAGLYARACQSCHGETHTGTGRLGTASVLPEDTFAAHLQQYGPACTREIFIEKIRHGSYLGFAGVMPPFSREVLGDGDVADLLAYLGVPAGDTCAP